MLCRQFRALILLAILLLCRNGSSAYSVLTHEQVVDMLWGDVIEPLLKTQYPGLTQEQLKEAHAYAYGGAAVDRFRAFLDQARANSLQLPNVDFDTGQETK